MKERACRVDQKPWFKLACIASVVVAILSNPIYAVYPSETKLPNPTPTIARRK